MRNATPLLEGYRALARHLVSESIRIAGLVTTDEIRRFRAHDLPVLRTAAAEIRAEHPGWGEITVRRELARSHRREYAAYKRVAPVVGERLWLVNARRSAAWTEYAGINHDALLDRLRERDLLEVR